MSRENVEVVRRIYEAAAGPDANTVLSLYDLSVELDGTRVAPAGMSEVCRGHDGLRKFFRQWHEAWQDITDDHDELIDAGEQLVSVVTRRGRGRSSGADVEWHVALVWTLRERKVVRVEWFRTRDDAIEAAG